MKISYNAGHIKTTPGKRLPAALDPNETREWVLNDRVARHFATEMAKYEGVELRRMDDPNGVKNIDIEERVANANAWGADLYLSFHHNAAGKLFSGGGTEVYIDATGGESEKYAKAIYDAVIAATGLKGNRADPLRSTSDGVKLYECRATKMPAVLVEYGFMDSKVDAPIILTDDFSKKAGVATAQAVAKVKGLKKKATAAATTEKSESGVLYRVQVGAYSNKANAEAMIAKLKKAGFDGFITKSGEAVTDTKPQKSVDELAREVINGKWGDGAERKKNLTDEYGEAIAKAVQDRVNELLG